SPPPSLGRGPIQKRGPVMSKLGPSWRPWRHQSSYGFGETRVGLLALLTFIVPLGPCSGGVVMAKFSGHDFTFRSSSTVYADTPTPGSASTCIRSGQPPRSVWSAAILFTLYRMIVPPAVRLVAEIVHNLLIGGRMHCRTVPSYTK